MSTPTSEKTTDASSAPDGRVGSGPLLGEFLRVLNEAYAADPAAIHALVCNRVPCNRPLADHPTIQVAVNVVAAGETYEVGTIGIINGICEAVTGKRVAVMFSEADPKTGRSKMVGFMEYA